MHPKRTTCILYLTATCNLKCRYCFIDKSPILKKIDEKLEQSYKTNYYKNFIDEIFDDKEALKRMEFWGGEPSYGLPRTYDTIKWVIENYPNFEEIMMSTNLTTKTVVEDLINFWKFLEQFSNRNFNFYLQLSLDGPEYLNDYNRGKNTTKLFTENFKKLIDKIQDFNKNSNVKVHAHFKPTLANDTIAMLQTKEAVIEYYKFFEQYVDIVNEKELNNNFFFLSLTNPNVATPAPTTVQDGKNFANLCKIIFEVEQENPRKRFFKYPRQIMPFAHEFKCCPNHTLYDGCGTCGTGSSVVGLLPEGQISTCHNGFVELLTAYKEHGNNLTEKDDIAIDFNLFITNNDKNFVIFNKEKYSKFEKQVALFNREEKFQITELASLITLYARSNQIDKKYLNSNNAIEAARFIQTHTASCMRDNLGITGTKYLFQYEYIKLFLNGAKEYIELTEK